ncbi:hypothetical protein Syun_015066 [Stephania yunnanensis]|uniref:Uncharacterized protein n=1 Tax=Stephania yunnanensis TaxID=152371 RepID=A0AAP0JLK6_9MAGN
MFGEDLSLRHGSLSGDVLRVSVHGFLPSDHGMFGKVYRYSTHIERLGRRNCKIIGDGKQHWSNVWEEAKRGAAATLTGSKEFKARQWRELTRRA